MNTRHAEIRIWTAYRDELTAWLCLLDDRYADELSEAEQSSCGGSKPCGGRCMVLATPILGPNKAWVAALAAVFP